jgi:hypothetical protein
MTMTLSLQIMAGLGVLAGAVGLPILLAPRLVRALFGWRPTPQLPVILRIVGAMLASLGLILLVFAFAYAGAQPAQP